jgi:hypothetical protein
MSRANKRPSEPAWLKLGAKLRRPAEFAGLAQMVAGYERAASDWFAEYCALEEARQRSTTETGTSNLKLFHKRRVCDAYLAGSLAEESSAREILARRD